MAKENEIRFRVDTFEKALSIKRDLCDEEQMEAYHALKNIILKTSKTQMLFLQPKDLIFINNKTMLHGRGQFTDADSNGNDLTHRVIRGWFIKFENQ
mgnify:CR=1 FL=1